MIPLLKFNTFQKDDWTGAFQNHICKTLKKPECWPNCAPLIQQTLALRNEFNFEGMNKHLKVDASWMIWLTKMEEYLRKVNYLSSRFKFGKSKDSVAGFKSRWWCALTQNNYESTHIRFDTINFTYNYAMMQFNVALMNIAKDADQGKLKEGLKQLRQAKWAINETKKFAYMMKSAMKLPFEFSDENLGFMHAMFDGLLYKTMLRIYESAGREGMDICSLQREVYIRFDQAKRLLDVSKDLRKYHAGLVSDTYYNYYASAYETLARAARLALAEHEAAMTKGHNGIAICYMKQLQGFIQLAEKDKNLKKEDKQKHEAMFKAEFAQLMKDTIEKNDKVYHAPVPNPKDIEFIKKWENDIPELAPVNVYTPPEGHEHFQHFLSEELEKIESNLMLYVTNKKQFVQKLYYDMQNKKEQVYRERNIDFILQANNMGTASLGEHFKADLDVVTKMFGGLQGYESLKNKLQNEKADVQGILASIDQKVTKTKQDDATFVQQIKQNKGEGLIEYAHFDVANGDLINNIIGVHTSFQRFGEMEGPMGSQYDQNKKWLIKFSDPNVNWGAYTHADEAKAYLSQHKEDIDLVIKVEGMISQIGGLTLQKYEELNGTLDSFEMWKYVSQVAMRQITEEDVYKALDDQTKAKFEDFDDMASKTIQALDKLAEKAAKLTDISKYANQSELNDLLTALKFFKDAHPKMSEIVQGYHKLAMEASKARDLLDDYIVAKEIERHNLLDDLNRRKSEMANELAAKKLQEEEMRKAQQSQPTKAPAPAPTAGLGLGGQSNFYPTMAPQQPQRPQKPQAPSYGGNMGGGYQQTQAPVWGNQGWTVHQTYTAPQPGYQQQLPAGGKPIYGNQQQSWGGQGWNVKANFGGNQQQGGYNPYMNTQFPPWYNPQNPRQGPSW